MRLLAFISLFSLMGHFAAAQVAAQDAPVNRGSIPEELIRPKRGEALRYPIDTVIGSLGQGEASDAAFSYANFIAAGFTSGDMSHPSLAGINSGLRESYLSALNEIQPESYRMGSGREEPDGSVSFLIRFLGKEQSITGELFIRFVTRYREAAVEDIKVENEEENENEEVKVTGTVSVPSSGSWALEELLLEEPVIREEQSAHYSTRELFDFLPYERFF